MIQTLSYFRLVNFIIAQRLMHGILWAKNTKACIGDALSNAICIEPLFRGQIFDIDAYPCCNNLHYRRRYNLIEASCYQSN